MNLYFIDDDHAAHVYHNIMVSDIENEAILVSNFYSVDEVIEKLKAIINTGHSNEWPDAIILDINMPIKTGWKFLEEYTDLKKYSKKTRIFMATNSENPADILKAEENPLVEGYKIKYLESDFFLQLLQDHSAL